MKNAPFKTYTNRSCFHLAKLRHLPSLFLAVFCLVGFGSAQADTFYWDPALASSSSDGNGNWHDPNVWWNGTAQTWADNNQAVFGAGATTNFVVNVESAATATLLVITNSANVTFTNVNKIALATGSAAVGTTGVGLWAANNTVLTTSNLITSGLKQFLGTNTVWNAYGGWTLSGNPYFTGANTNSVLNLISGNFQGAGNLILGAITVNQTGGTNFAGTAGKFEVGRVVSGSPSQPGGMAIYNLSDPAAIRGWGNHFSLCRDTTGNPSGIFNMSGGNLDLSCQSADGALVLNQNTQPAGGCQAIVNFSGGTMNIGTGPTSGTGGNFGGVGISDAHLNLVSFFSGGNTYLSNSAAIFNMSGGVLTAKGFSFGFASGNYAASPTNQLNVTGGLLFLDSFGINFAKNTGTNFSCNLSGGTIAATANWSPASQVPINLGTQNGNITFQSSDTNGTPFNITLAGPLTGVGGLTKTGSGTLILSGTNNYSGLTLIRDGALTNILANVQTNGGVTLDGSAGNPVLSIQVSGPGQRITMNGNLTYAAGTPTSDFNFGSGVPSSTVAPIQLANNLNFAVAPNFTVEGTAIPVGLYPLIHYGGTLTGTMPTAPTSLPVGTTAVITNIAASKTVALLVTASPIAPLYWADSNGIWNTTTANWSSNGVPVTYVNDGTKDIIFDDSAAGASPISISLASSLDIVCHSLNSENATKSYILTGPGRLVGGTAVNVSGPAGLTMTASNTYSGGTTVTAPGQLNINYGGDGVANSAIGTGTLTINANSKIDNTSGHAVTLITPVPQYWGDDWTFVGSTNLDFEGGSVILGNNLVTLNVLSNSLTVGDQIGDNGANLGLAKVGPGSLTLSNYNSFNGGMVMTEGTLNINNDQAVGTGLFTINGGTIDNTSGSAVTLTQPASMIWNGSFTFQGTTNLDIAGAAFSLGSQTVTLTVVSNTFITEGALSGGNRQVTKTGAGTWQVAGFGNNVTILYVVNAGTLAFNKQPGYYAAILQPVTVNAGATLLFMGQTGRQIGSSGASLVNNGGTIDLNADNEAYITTFNFASGSLLNSAPTSTAEVGDLIDGAITLGSTNCVFDPVASDSILNIDKVIVGTGTLIKTGAGLLNLQSAAGTNNYTGPTLVQTGTLALLEPNTISNSASIHVYANATLDVSLRGDTTLTLYGGQTLLGDGNINGNVASLPGSVVAPGGNTTVGRLTVTNNITLNGNLTLSLNRTNAQTSSSLASVLGTITYGGTLTVTNFGPALHAGDVFHLFPSAVTTFSGFNLATTDANGYTYTWQNNVAIDGSVTVTGAVPSVNPLPGPIQFNVSGTSLSLSWPTNLGWILQTQTNPLSVGLWTNWMDVSNSSQVTSTNISVNPANGGVFFRLRHP